jgi:hypothetical protein
MGVFSGSTTLELLVLALGTAADGKVHLVPARPFPSTPQ